MSMNNTYSLSQNLVGVARIQTAAKTLRWHLALVFLLLCFSGNPAVCRQGAIDILYSGFTVFLAVLLIYQRRRVVTPDLMIIGCLFGAILLIQSISFSFFPMVTIAGFFIRLFIGYAVIRLVGDFPRFYVLAMVGLAVMSLFFYIPYLMLNAAGISAEGLITGLSTSLHTINLSCRRPLFLHTFMGSYSPRNAGMFWEPGAFAGYLSLAMVFLAIIKERLSRRAYTYYLIILSIALLTTLSTTGYIVYPLILLLHYGGTMQAKKKISAKIMLTLYIVLPLIIAGSFIAYNKLPFLREKIEGQMYVLDMREGRWHRGRMGSIVFDWEYIKQRPLTGWGLHSKTRYSLHPGMESSEGMGNGFSDFIAKFGITGMLIWLFCVFRGMMHLTKRNLPATMLILLILCLVIQGEIFLAYSVFLGLMFLRTPSSSPIFSKTLY